MFGRVYNNPGKTNKSTVTVACEVLMYKGSDLVGNYWGPEGREIQEADIPFSWGKIDFIEMKVTVSYDLFRHATIAEFPRAFPFVGKGRFSFAQKWRLYYPEQGVHLHPLAPTSSAPEGAGDIAVEASMAKDCSPLYHSKPYVSVTVNLAGGLQDDGISVGYKGIEATIGKVKSSFKIGDGLRLTANLVVKDKPEKRKPKSPIMIPRELLSHTVTFETEDQQFASATELRRLEDKWYDSLLQKTPKLRDAIAAGACPITLDGYSSTTGSVQYNEGLSKKRVDSVASAIQGFFPATARLNLRRQPHGKSLAKTTGAAAQERRVVVSIAEADATRALTPAKK